MRAKGLAERHVYVDLRAMAEGSDSIVLLTDGAPSNDDFEVTDKDYGDGEVVADTEFKRKIPRPKMIDHHGPMDETKWLLEDIRRLTTECVLGLDQCNDDVPCPLHDTWKRFRENLLGDLEKLTLQDLVVELARKRSAKS